MTTFQTIIYVIAYIVSVVALSTGHTELGLILFMGAVVNQILDEILRIRRK